MSKSIEPKTYIMEKAVTLNNVRTSIYLGRVSGDMQTVVEISDLVFVVLSFTWWFVCLSLLITMG